MSPIKDPSVYPSDWKEIRERILARATPKDGFDMPRCECVEECEEHAGRRCYARHGWKVYRSFSPVKLVKVVLTLAHLDHDASAGDHSESNLKAMCQKCHLRYDARHRAAKWRNELATRQEVLF